ncbi:MAG: hypothetical protein ACI9WU_000112 [Myxococcota bacterium]|jgi:hypothetical protein
MLSFPQPRSARLWLGPTIQGQLLLSCADGGLQKRIIKLSGQPLLVHVYPVRARLMRVDSGHLSEGKALLLSKDTVRIQGEGLRARAPMGYRRELLWQKGADGALGLTAEVESPTQAWHMTLGYAHGIPGSGRLSLRHTALLGARHGRWRFGARGRCRLVARPSVLPQWPGLTTRLAQISLLVGL